MRIYYINQEKSIDINHEMARIGNATVRVLPIVGGALTAAHIASKVFVTGSAMYGGITFFEFLGFLPEGMADETFSKMYDTAVMMIERGMIK